MALSDETLQKFADVLNKPAMKDVATSVNILLKDMDCMTQDGAISVQEIQHFIDRRDRSNQITFETFHFFVRAFNHAGNGVAKPNFSVIAGMETDPDNKGWNSPDGSLVRGPIEWEAVIGQLVSGLPYKAAAARKTR